MSIVGGGHAIIQVSDHQMSMAFEGKVDQHLSTESFRERARSRSPKGRGLV